MLMLFCLDASSHRTRQQHHPKARKVLAPHQAHQQHHPKARKGETRL